MGIGQVTKNSIFISLVEKPVNKWEETFPNGLKLNKPVISVKEVLQKDNSNFIDVSMSSYQEDISDALTATQNIDDIRIFYESGFNNAMEDLRIKLRENWDSINIQPLLFDTHNSKLLSEEESILIFLGTSEKCEAFLSQARNTKFKQIILPSWISTIQTTMKPKSKNVPYGFCIVSHLQHQLTSNELNTWDKFLTIIKDEDLNSNNDQFRRNVKSKIFAGFTKNNLPIKKHIQWN